ncbi:hypothetical protein HHK36_008136 [Tetracentron sinense]|uniref:Uncharacterized protein n=1 Tax=Tetracentron sinense TaxID=13715 RepID=A0A834ZLX3_TETSI|nr:hypothetical protein HHK36_008136 [Tetracentron sinense]
MSATTSSVSYYKLANHGRSLHRSHAPVFSPYHLPGISKTSQRSHQLNFNQRVIILKRSSNMKISASNSSQPGSPPPAGSPSSGWNKWVLGLMLPLFLPFLRSKGGLISALKTYVDVALGRVETVAEVVEVLAKEVGKVAEEVEDKLPGDTKLKESLDLIEDIAKEAVEKADKAEEIINKVLLYSIVVLVYLILIDRCLTECSNLHLLKIKNL